MINCEELQQKVKNGDNVYLIDTRGADEHATSTIKAGNNIAVLLEPQKVGTEMTYTCGEDVGSIVKPPPDAVGYCLLSCLFSCCCRRQHAQPFSPSELGVCIGLQRSCYAYSPNYGLTK